MLAESPRKSRRMQGKPLEYTPSQLEKIKIERSRSTGSKASEEHQTSTILQSEEIETKVNPTQEIESVLVHSGPEINEVNLK